MIVQFHDLWHLYQAGDEIVTGRRKGKLPTQALRVLKTHGGRQKAVSSQRMGPKMDPKSRLRSVIQSAPEVTSFFIDAFYLDFNGTELTPVRERFEIKPYTDAKAIRDLEVYPIEYAVHVRPEELRERGKMFVDAVSAKRGRRMYCDGNDIDTGTDINGEVIVDMREFLKLRPQMAPEFTHAESLDISEINDYVPPEAVIQAESRALDGESDLADEDYLICHYRVYAYDLGTRRWGKFENILLQGVAWSERFDSIATSFSQRLLLNMITKQIGV